MGTIMLEECIVYIKRIEDEVRKCYSEPINLSSDEFVELMVIDGLFMIELFRKYAHIGNKIERGDPIFGKSEDLMDSVVDLVLLENQLPMVVLDCLFNVLALKKELNGETLNFLALRFLDQLIPRGEKVIYTNFTGCEVKHILDLLCKTYFHNLPEAGNAKKNSCISIPSVTELKRVGVKFVVGSTNGSFLDIKFKDGVMEIPPMVIKYETDTLLQNLIAYEQCSDGKVPYYMTSYRLLMDSLIKSGQDVRVLRKHGIVTSPLTDEDVAYNFTHRFNELCSEVTLTIFYYSELCEKVNSYYGTRRNACGPKLRTLRTILLKFFC
ncbi:hypothetical protein MKW98_000291 [Papaver atlanticum]|uniref:Uncharacterized protein n=1 Tax=Papaver atlanticum TaxID=357466 RepID=A0AAD4S0P4_9MAGN|nr:hypothetical protein MKW98_000291 [Papaver atlanticum]